MDIVKLCQLGESNTLEYKQDASSLTPILKTAVAFANTAGGIILIGVDDDGEIVGVDSNDKVQEQLANSIASRIKPQLIPEFIVTSINGKYVIALRIDHLPGPYYLAEKGLDGGVFVRVGSTSRPAGPEIIEELKRTSRYDSFDKNPCDNVTENDLDKARIASIYLHRGEKITTEKLISIGVLTQKGRHVVATNGGVILFGKPEVREKYFSYAEVRCARFKGTSRSEFIDRLNIEGGILSAITEVPKFIRRNTKMAGKFGEMKRRDIPEYPLDGIREALINALVHANYEITGSRIFVAVYDDKLEIQNPGIMLPGMNIEQFKAGVSRIRNPVIARTFGELELIEEWGSGYWRIKVACESGGYPQPVWEEFGSALRVTFTPHPETVEEFQPGAKSGTRLAPGWHQAGVRLEFDQDSMQIIGFCRESKAINEMMEQLSWLDRTKFRRKFVLPLLKAEVLRMTMPDKPSSPEQRYVTTDLGLEILKQNKK